jgi:1-acyl-sn-glycerol-3-phosphate acyltransferase
VRPPPKAVRRALIPVDVGVLMVLMALLSVGMLVGLIAAPFGSRRRLLRVAAFGLAYCTMELTVLGRCGVVWLRRALASHGGLTAKQRFEEANEHLFDFALRVVLGAARRCFGFTVVVDDHSVPGPLGGDRPVLVLARHAGPGDSFALVHLLMARYRRRVRIVLKDVLQLDPAIDVLLNRLGSCFLSTKRDVGSRSADRVGDVARRLETDEALLLFPEGANWTPERRRRAIRHLRRARQVRAAHVATLMDHVLPPRPAGVLACLKARPGIEVVVVAHAGLDRIVSVHQAWDAIPLEKAMTVRIWPTSPPVAEEDRAAWLSTEWAIVDEWVDAHRAEAQPSEQGGATAR